MYINACFNLCPLKSNNADDFVLRSTYLSNFEELKSTRIEFTVFLLEINTNDMIDKSGRNAHAANIRLYENCLLMLITNVILITFRYELLSLLRKKFN